MGHMYFQGQGVPQDYANAVEWYRKAAEQNDAQALYNLGVMYVQGRGVPKDLAKALEWIRKAAAQGHEGAQKVLQEME